MHERIFRATKVPVQPSAEQNYIFAFQQKDLILTDVSSLPSLMTLAYTFIICPELVIVHILHKHFLEATYIILRPEAKTVGCCQYICSQRLPLLLVATNVFAQKAKRIIVQILNWP